MKNKCIKCANSCKSNTTLAYCSEYTEKMYDYDDYSPPVEFDWEAVSAFTRELDRQNGTNNWSYAQQEKKNE